MHIPLEELSEYIDHGKDLVTRGKDDLDGVNMLCVELQSLPGRMSDS